MEIRVYKSRRVLEVWDGQVLKATFPCGIGKVEQGHKIRREDLRTPEGDYRVCVKNPKSKFHLSLGLTYPNTRDAELGLASGVINPDDHARIMAAHSGDLGPPWDTALGGEIYIHGDLEKQAWSEGCIRLNNPDMERVFAWVDKGATVRIVA